MLVMQAKEIPAESFAALFTKPNADDACAFARVAR